MNKIKNKSALIDPKDWDFREVTEEQLETAIQYEYFRENKEIKAAAIEWLETKNNSGTNRAIFLSEYLGEDPALHHLSECWSEVLGYQYSVFLFHFPLFPEPWLTHSDEARFRWNHYKRLASTIRVIAPGEHYFEKREILIDMDLNRKTDDIINDLEKAVRNEVKKLKEASGIQTKKGVAASKPWHKLRHLSALRLHNAGLSHKKAQIFLKEHCKGPTTNAVIPNFADEKVWHGALKSARGEAARFTIAY